MAAIGKEIANLSLKTLFGILAALLLLGIYIGIILYGDNSLTRLNEIEAKEKELQQKIVAYGEKNKKLQKEYFELLQLLPKDEE